MTKAQLNKRLNRAIGRQISGVKFAKFFSCFAEHVGYMARFFGYFEGDIRPRGQLRNAQELTGVETELFCKYCGYDLTREDTPPLW